VAPTPVHLTQARRRRSRRGPLVAVLLGLVVVAVGGAALVRRFWPGRVHTGSAAAHGATIVRYEIH